MQYPFGLDSLTPGLNIHGRKTHRHFIFKDIQFAVAIENTGAMDGDEVAQVYIKYPGIDRMPLKKLKDLNEFILLRERSKPFNLAFPLANYKNGILYKRNGCYTPVSIRFW